MDAAAMGARDLMHAATLGSPVSKCGRPRGTAAQSIAKGTVRATADTVITLVTFARACSALWHCQAHLLYHCCDQVEEWIPWPSMIPYFGIV